MPTTIREAPEARLIGKSLIAECHNHLRNVRMDFVFIERLDKDGVSQPIESKGKALLGRAKKVTGLNAYLAESTDEQTDEPVEFYVIELSYFYWRSLTEKQRRALIDHELCHCETDEEGKPKMRTHDVEEFSEVIKRHGLWRPDVEQFVKVGAEQFVKVGAEQFVKVGAEQLALPLEENGREKKPAKKTAHAASVKKKPTAAAPR
jgi:hypothetical protein